MRFASIKAVIERSAQISLMSRIYKLATRAIICVGEEDRNSRMVIHYMKNKAKMDGVCNNRFSELNIPFTPATLLEVKAIRSSLKRLRFGRVWVLQEVASSSSAIVFCGSRAISWGTFSKVIRSEFVQELVEIIPFILRAGGFYFTPFALLDVAVLQIPKTKFLLFYL